MKRALVPAGKAVGAAGLTGLVLYLVATAPAHVHVYWPYWLFLAAIVIGIALFFVGLERTPSPDNHDVLPPSTDASAGPTATHPRQRPGALAGSSQETWPRTSSTKHSSTLDTSAGSDDKDSAKRARELAEKSEGLGGQARTQALDKALGFVREIPHQKIRAETIAKISCHLDDDHLVDAVKIGGPLDESNCLVVIRSVASCLMSKSSELRRRPSGEILTVVIGFDNDVTRGHAIRSMIRCLDSKQIAQAFDAIPGIHNEFSRASLIAELAPHLHSDQVGAAIELALGMPNDQSRSRAVSALIPKLSDGQLSKAAAAVRSMPKGQTRSIIESVASIRGLKI